MTTTLNNLDRLESESIHIMREAVATAERPVMLYSIGKDSSVLVHLALKAFYPSVPPFPLLHVDTTWKFQEMYKVRDAVQSKTGMELVVHQNPYCVEHHINPFDHGSETHTHLWKTEGLKQALDLGRYDLSFAGARRDEERSRAKERVFSVRSSTHQWDPKAQRPELWHLYNTSVAFGQTLRAFPLSNWTELDIWRYIEREQIAVVSLYFAKVRPVVVSESGIIMVDDDRYRLSPGDQVEDRLVRFRTLGCYPLTGGVESSASNVAEIIEELEKSETSERSGRLIDRDRANSMEMKRQEGYF